MEIDEHVGCAMSGLTADARTLVEHGRVETQVLLLSSVQWLSEDYDIWWCFPFTKVAVPVCVSYGVLVSLFVTIIQGWGFVEFVHIISKLKMLTNVMSSRRGIWRCPQLSQRIMMKIIIACLGLCAVLAVFTHYCTYRRQRLNWDAFALDLDYGQERMSSPDILRDIYRSCRLLVDRW